MLMNNNNQVYLKNDFRRICEYVSNSYQNDRKNLLSYKKDIKEYYIAYGPKEQSRRSKYSRRLGNIPRSSKRFRKVSRAEKEKRKQLLTLQATSGLVDYRTVNIPNITSSLDPILKNNIRNFRTPVISDVSYSDVETSDRETFGRYTSLGKIIPQALLPLLVKSGSLTAYNLGWYDPSPKPVEEHKPFLISQIVDQLIKDSNSGHPLHLSKKIPEAIEYAVSFCKRIFKKPLYYSFFKKNFTDVNFDNLTDFGEMNKQPNYILHRLQLSEENQNKFNIKIRQVWNVPFSIIMLEAIMFEPMMRLVKQHTLKSESPIFGIGLNNQGLSDKQIKHIRKVANAYPELRFLSGDYKQFDSNYLDIFDDIFFALWLTQIKLTPNQYLVYCLLRLYTKFTPFVYKDELYVTECGICSGSFTTSMRVTQANATLWYLADILISYSGQLYKELLRGFLDVVDLVKEIGLNLLEKVSDIPFYIIEWLKVYGDDCISIITLSFGSFVSEVCKFFGHILTFKEPRKSNESFYFLGRYWDTDSKPYQSFQYMYAHIVKRMKWYKRSEINFDISENLELYRALSICLPFRNGRKFLDTHLGNWLPYIKFKKSGRGFNLLKEWPNEDYIFIPREDMYNYMLY